MTSVLSSTATIALMIIYRTKFYRFFMVIHTIAQVYFYSTIRQMINVKKFTSLVVNQMSSDYIMRLVIFLRSP